MTLGDRIRTARELAGMTQEELARRVGTTQRSVGSWERGMHPPRSIARLEAVLGPLTDASIADRSPALNLATDAQILTELANRLAAARVTSATSDRTEKSSEQSYEPAEADPLAEPPDALRARAAATAEAAGYSVKPDDRDGREKSSRGVSGS